MNTFVHVDLDAFFASVEQLDHIEYRGKPVIVGGIPGDRRAVVSTASYEARAYGVHSAMPLYKAVHLCPDGIFVRGNMQRYHEMSQKVMAIFADFSPDVLQMSVDEAFIDLTGTERLFGNPVETAREIKRRVKAETGLTVSIGLASTKYLAKIASGMQKPDGLFVIPAGQEENFMLSLPLEKVWGAGTKTLERLHQNGIHTTRDIHDKSLELLQSIFGKASASFLYGAVRGLEVESFGEAKTHSISAENTYLFDLWQEDALNTALLELSYTVAFRMLKEKVRSSTVCIKIRYDDFSTVTVQDTQSSSVSSMEDLFERSKRLFWKKYDPNRSIRLLGVGLQNVESTSLPEQGKLFDFGDEKRRKVEQAVLEAQKKNPGIKITKARLLSSPLILLAGGLFLLGPKTNIHAQTAARSEQTTIESDGAGSIVFDSTKLPLLGSDERTVLYDTQIGNQDVFFSAEGWWQSTVSNTTTATFGFGSATAVSLGTPVFSQKVDLLLSFLLNRHWYFEAAFADGFDKNMVAAGYRGDETVREVRIANRGITFPGIYSVNEFNRSIGGGDNEAFGISSHLEGSIWKSHAALRYDMLSSQEKDWYGKNAVSETLLSLTNWMSGNLYVLASNTALEHIRAVYVETDSGTIQSARGRRYKKLDESQYLTTNSHVLVLSKDAGAKRKGGVLPSVLITFDDGIEVSDEALLVTDLLSDCAEWFGMEEKDLEKYAPVSERYDTIEGSSALCIQKANTFSPFTVTFRYDAGITSAGEAGVISKTTRAASQSYLAEISDDELFLASSSFFYSNHTYVDVYGSEADTSSWLKASVRFPFGKDYPKLYLTREESADLAVSVKAYTSVNSFDIGTRAVSGTVQVYKNGVLDAGATYNEDSGEVTLSSAVSDSDHIRITWYEQNDDSQNGSLALATGFLVTPFENLSMDISLASRWSLSRQDFATSDSTSPGFVTFASKISYDDGFLSLSNTVSSSIETVNTTGLYRISGMDDSHAGTSYLSKYAASDLPEFFVPELNGRTETDDFPELLLEKNGSVPKQDGKRDSEISGYAVPVSWDFTSFDESDLEENCAWAATAISLSDISLYSASIFSFWIKNADPAETDFDLYLQLGVSSDDDFGSEDTSLIPSWKISDASGSDVRQAFNPSSEEGTIVSVQLTDEDRSRLTEYQNARLIITANKNSSGTIYAGPYEAQGSVCEKEADAAYTFRDYQTEDASLTAKKVRTFNSSDNYVQKIEWEADFSSINTSSATSTDISPCDIKISRYFSEVDLERYQNLSLFFKLESAVTEDSSPEEQEEYFRFELERSNEEKEAVYVSLSKDSFGPFFDGQWHELNISLKEKSVSIDGSSVSAVECSVNNDIIPNRLSLTVQTVKGSSFVSKGSLSFDELSLSDPQSSVIVQDKASLGYKKSGQVFEGSSLVKDLSLKASATASSVVTDNSTAFSSEASGAVTVSKLKTEVSVSHEQSSSKAISTASHFLSTDGSILNIFSFSDSFSYDWEGKTAKKNSSALFSLKEFSIPLKISADTASSADKRRETQTSEAQATFESEKFTASIGASVYQSIAESKKEKAFSFESYASSLADASELAFSTGDKNASSRKIATHSEAVFSLPSSIKPRLFFETQGTYKNAASNLFSDTTRSGFSVPFKVQKNTFTFSWKKTASGITQTPDGKNYQDDAASLSESWKSENWYFSSFPVYDLLSKNLSSSMKDEITEKHTSLSYSGLYEASWKRGRLSSALDYLLPSSLSASFSREITASSSLSDYYQTKTSLSYSALNLFGKNGSLSVTDWFSQDEYMGSFNATLKIPRNGGDSTMLYTAYLQSQFLSAGKNTFKAAFEGTLQDRNNWSAKETFIWKRNGKSSLILSFLDLWNNTLEKHVKLTRSEKVQFSQSRTKSGTKAVQKAAGQYSHLLDIALSNHITINTAVETGCSVTVNSLITVTASWSVGGTISF